jgi:hypothetical protein
MNTPFALVVLCACVLSLGACDKTPTSPPTPMVDKPVPTESDARAGAVASPSAPADATKVDPKPGRSNDTISAAQESTAMPMPGQNNDHSAPLGPAKRATSP